MEIYNQKLYYYNKLNNQYKIDKYNFKLNGGTQKNHDSIIKLLKFDEKYKLILSFNDKINKNTNYKPIIYIYLKNTDGDNVIENFYKYSLIYIKLIYYIIVCLYLNIDKQTIYLDSIEYIKNHNNNIHFKNLVNVISYIIRIINEINLNFNNYKNTYLVNYNFNDVDNILLSNNNLSNKYFSSNKLSSNVHFHNNDMNDKLFIAFNTYELFLYLINNEDHNVNLSEFIFIASSYNDNMKAQFRSNNDIKNNLNTFVHKHVDHNILINNPGVIFLHLDCHYKYHNVIPKVIKKRHPLL